MSSIESDTVLHVTPQQPVSQRGRLVVEAGRLICGERDKEYGDPAINMGCAGALKRVVRDYAQRTLSEAEQEALDMLLSKISRSVTGRPKRDTFVDMVGYAAIYGEMALRTKTEKSG